MECLGYLDFAHLFEHLINLYLGQCYLMQDDLQKAYTAYQQALYLLPNPKVYIHFSWQSPLINSFSGGSQTMVWYRYPLRSIWFPRPCRRSFLLGSSYVQRSVWVLPPFISPVILNQ